ncbi:MAG TPA: hypothetical protein VL484_00850 [Vicinamibacterales bacterium]|nr:hypothetical protein [Vicinamibacterales bacterium]
MGGPGGAIASILLILAAAAPASAQNTAVAANDSDPTRPILFSLRPEFYRIGDDAWRMQIVNRYDTALVRNRPILGGKRGMLLRFELPVSVSETPSLPARAGIGDAYGQVLLVPHLTRRFAFVAGSGLSIPTASAAQLGSGKWTLAPAAIPLWFVPRGLFYVKAQDFVSVAGDASRPDINFLLITPTWITRAGRRSWVLVDTETKSDWQRNGRTSIKSGVQFGAIWRGVGVWVKPEVPWGPNRDGLWTIKTGLVWYRART